MKSYISAIGTSNPVFSFDQMKIVDFMATNAGMDDNEKKKLAILYKASGIKKRHSVLPDFGLQPDQYSFFSQNSGEGNSPGVRERMKVYEKECLPLALKAIRNCFLKHPYLSPLQITHIITVSCTGMYAPGLDIEIIEALHLPGSTRRTCINYMGCYAAFNALKVADSICRSEESAKVLIVSVELCTIHYQNKKDWDTLLSNALFSDGAAAVIVENKPANSPCLLLNSFQCDISNEGASEMAWHISDFGFEMTLSSYVPDLIQKGIGKLTNKILGKMNIDISAIDCFAIHPGGKRILEVIESVLQIPKEKNKLSHKVLAEYGNMSSTTIFFVLKEVLESLTNTEEPINILSFAFGPGLTMESMLLQSFHTDEYQENKLSSNNKSAHVPASII